MSSKRKNPAKKATMPAPKKGGTSKERAAKDANAPKTPRAPKAPRERDPRLPAIGQTITKERNGKTLTVLCTAEGFEFRGKNYRSLSAVAKDAFGQPSINGFLAFGLVSRGPAKEKRAAAPKTKGPKVGCETNEIGTDAGQRAALEAAGIAKKRAPKREAK
jgi:hypothetical protein